MLEKQLIERALLREGRWHKPPVLHSDNGAPMTSYTLRARLAELGMPMSHSRPRVSNDNPYSESLFRTLKYCLFWPSKGFASVADGRDWLLAFENAYNNHPLHSGINFFTPECTPCGQRSGVYSIAKRPPKRSSFGADDTGAIAAS